MRTTIVLSVILFVPAFASSATIIVPDDYGTIQAAIDAAVDGDTVLVRPNTYVENIDFNGKAITVTSEQGVDVTFIDGNLAGSVVKCQSGEGPDSVLDGFTVTNGTAANGGGMLNGNSSPTLTNCTFSGNSADHDGGGMYNENSSPTLTNCTFSGNTVFDYGGGMFNYKSSPTLTHCTFSGNTVYSYGGGGMYNRESSPTLTHCTFSGNSTEDFGGGMYNRESSPTLTNCTFSENSVQYSAGGMGNINSNPTLTHCTFTGNSTYYGGGDGGGMGNINSSPTLTHCTFTGNMAGTLGGGMFNEESSPTVTNCSFSANSALGGGGMSNRDSSSPMVTNCSFRGNLADFGGGMSNRSSSPTVTNCSFTGNSAYAEVGGMSNWHKSSPTVTNTIFWNNDVCQGPEIGIGDAADPSTLTISYSDVKGGQSSVYMEPGCTLNWGPGMIDSDPLFLDPGYWDDNGTPSHPYDDFWVDGDYHLTFNSPCRASGENSAATELTDFEGDPRIAYGTVDMGADEFYTHLYNTGNATPGGTVKLKFIDLPGASPVGFWIAFNALETPIPGAYGDWWLLSPMVGPFDIGSIPTNGVYELPGTIPATPPGPYTLYLQAIMGSPLQLTNLCTLDVE